MEQYSTEVLENIIQENEFNEETLIKDSTGTTHNALIVFSKFLKVVFEYLKDGLMDVYYLEHDTKVVLALPSVRADNAVSFFINGWEKFISFWIYALHCQHGRGFYNGHKFWASEEANSPKATPSRSDNKNEKSSVKQTGSRKKTTSKSRKSASSTCAKEVSEEPETIATTGLS
ncbi:Hypothetical predicted protein [Mytilus galloprovincialis]|uniref:Uncharacterized protein n=1 Tax=Mytilus galloprovincialis TaxID=29158 RepID=A0A8B6GRT3_MYTGA|nr:Hypothetical predicted protein [Mytilus galloprovincialis]